MQQRQTDGIPASTFRRPWVTRRSVLTLTPDERLSLTDAQVAATRPIVTGVLLSGAVILAITGLFEATGVTPGIGYPWWLLEVVAAAVAGCAHAMGLIDDWRPRLVLALLSTIVLGVFLSIPTPGESGQLAIRTGLFQLLPMAMLALLVRPLSIATMVGIMLGLAYVRVAMHGLPATGAGLYWLFTATTVGFGLLMGAYRTEYAVSSFRLRRRMQHQAGTDELTNLPNRAGWNRDATKAYEVALTGGLPLSLVFFDIDLFKSVNDVHGHEAGDRVLQMLGCILLNRVDNGSYCARLGGEEFVVLFIDHSPEQVEGFVKRVRREFSLAASDYGTRVSGGVAHRQSGESMSEHLRRADLALYEAKTAGRDQFMVSRP